MMGFDLVSRLEGVGAIKHNGHFVLKSGQHAGDYADFDNAFPHAQLMHDLGFHLANLVRPAGPQGLVAPGVGGIALLQWVGLGLYKATGKWPLLFWADKGSNGDFVYERAIWPHMLDGLRVAAVEDVITRRDRTSTLGTVIGLAEDAGAEVVAAAAALNRKGATAESLQVPVFRELAAPDYPSWEAEECRLCQSGQPVVRVGHWLKFVQDNPGYPAIGWQEL